MRIYRRGGGKIYWCAFWDASAGKHRRVSTHLTDRAAALAAGARLERNGADPDGAAAAEATLSSALDAVIAEYVELAREKLKAAETVSFYRKRAGQILRMVAEGVLPPLLADLRARHVDAMVDHRRAEGTSRHTIAKDLIVLRLALKLAKRRGLWRGDVDEVLPHRFGAGYKPVERWLPPSELWALLGELRPDRAAWVAFAVATGANYSEAAKARLGDVFGDQANEVYTKVHLRGTKRATRDREVPVVFPWQTRLIAAALSAAGTRDLFTAPWSSTNMVRDLGKACAKAGIAPCSSNDLRRTFGTWMRASGASLELLAPAMGHATTRMAELVYARLDVSQLAALMTGQAGGAVRSVYADESESTESPHESEG